MKLLKFFILSTFLVNTAYSMKDPKYMPAVLMPGISSDVQAAEPFKERLEKKFTGIYVKIIAPLAVGLHDGWARIAHVRKQIQKDRILMSAPTYNLVCHSQGTLDGRGMVETKSNSDPQVYNYIGLSGPQAGEFGTPETLLKEVESLLDSNNPAINELLADFLKSTAENIHTFLYTKLAQDNISCAGYWKDPLHYEEYLKNSRFLPLLNNEKEHKNAQKYKANVMALNTMVLMSSLREEEIKPRHSSLFWFYKPGSDRIIETFDERYNTNNDPLGLFALSCQNKLKFLQANCLHTKFWDDETVFNMVAQYAGVITDSPPNRSSNACCCDLV